MSPGPDSASARPRGSAAVAILAFVALLDAGCAARQSIPVAATADLMTTELVIARGGHEANPLMQPAPVRVSLKVALSAVLIWACERLERDGHHGWSKAAQWGGTGLWGGAAVWNAREATR